MIDMDAIKARFARLAPYLDERARWLFAANEALTAGWGGITAVSQATGVARSTIGRGLAELRSDDAPLIKVSDAEMAAINLACDDFHGEWNYTISPQPRAQDDR